MVRVAQKTVRTVQATDAALGCLPEDEDKLLLLKIPRTPDPGPKGIKVDLTRKRPLRGLALIVLGDAVKAAEGGKQPDLIFILYH